jgi:hypothetical protein
MWSGVNGGARSGADLNTVLHAPTLHGILKSPSDAVGVAQDEHRLGRRTRQIFGSKGKDVSYPIQRRRE